MEIKGTAVQNTPDYIKEFYPSRFFEWLQSLPPSSKRIFEQPIYSTGWYNLVNSVIIPTQKAGDLFFDGNHKNAAGEIGRYGAEVTLKGVYKIFLKVCCPHYLLSKASCIYSTYYKPSDIKVLDCTDKSCVLQLAQFKQDELLIMERIAGWLTQTLEITQKKAQSVDIHTEALNGEFISTITVKWNNAPMTTPRDS